MKVFTRYKWHRGQHVGTQDLGTRYRDIQKQQKRRLLLFNSIDLFVCVIVYVSTHVLHEKKVEAKKVDANRFNYIMTI